MTREGPQYPFTDGACEDVEHFANSQAVARDHSIGTTVRDYIQKGAAVLALCIDAACVAQCAQRSGELASSKRGPLPRARYTVGSTHVDDADESAAPRSVSFMRTATTMPEAKVSAATNHIAAESPRMSAMEPASSAPIA